MRENVAAARREKGVADQQQDWQADAPFTPVATQVRVRH